MDTNKVFKKAVNLLTISSFLLSTLAFAAPEGGSVAQGSATISQSGAQTIINQSSQNAVINWNSFNTASHEAVQFNQPNSSAVALNRITNGLPTEFAGSLNANGQVWILNPAGVLFTSTAQVDVAGLVATTHGITNENFMAGNYRFDLVPGSEASSIINNGLISAKDSGIVALVGPHVANNGLIQANLGKVHLASGAAYTLDMYGDQLINFGSNAPIQNGSVSNAGNIIANGGKVYMTANYAANVLDNMISMSGTIEAKSVGVNQKGEIVLYAGDYQAKKVSGVTKVSGKLKTSSDDKSIGGFIETSGAYVEIAPTAEIDAGQGGSWLLDPWNITVVAGSGLVNNGGATGFVPNGTSSQIGANLINTQLGAGTNVILDTNSVGGDVGNITISSPITWSTAAVLTLIANNNIAVNAALNGSTTGFVNLQAGGSITGAGVISANTLTTSSVTGLSLTGLNTAANFNATNTTSGNVAYTHTGALNITGITQNVGNLTISNTGAITQSGPISVSGTSSFTAGAGAITLNDPANNLVGAVTFSNTGANNVSIVNNPNLILGASTIGQSFSATTNASSITLNGNVTSGVNQTYNDPVLINANLTLTATAGVLTFTSTIDDTALRSRTLTLASPGLVIFGGAVGTTTALNTLNLTQNSFTVDPTLASFIAGQLNVGTNLRLTSTAGDVTIGSPITQTINVVPITLSLVASNLINLNSSISLLPGSTLSLTQPSYNVNAALAAFIVGQLNAGTNFILNSSASTITVSSPITQTVNAGNVLLTLAATGANNINQPITLITGGSLVASGAPINLGANISTGGSQSYNSATALTAGPITVISAASSIAFSSLSGAFSLIVNAATTAAFGGVNVGALDVTAPGGIATNANVTTVGDLSFHNSTSIPSFLGTTYQTTGGGNMLVTGSAASYATLIMNSSNILYLRGSFSHTYGISATATNHIDLGANMYAGYGTTLNSPTRVTSPSVLSSGYAVNVLNNTVEGPSSLQLAQAGAANGGATNILYAVGTPGNPLSSFTVSQPVDNITVNAPIYAGTVSLYTNSNYMFNGGTITLGSAAVITATTFDANAAAGITFNGGAAVNTTGAQSYYVWGNGGSGLIGPIALVGGDVSLTGSTMTFYYSTGINSDAIATPRSLTVNGNAVFFMPTSGIGNTNPLNILHVTGTTSITTPVIHTASNQLFDGAVTLGSASSLTSNAGNILFSNTINGGFGLTTSVSNGQSVTFNGAVGGTTALTSITTSATGATYINGGQVRTSSGAQNWNNQVYISADTILGGIGTTGPININFALDSLNSTHRTLTLNTTAMSFLNGNLGAINPLLGLTVQNAATINVNSIYTDVFQNYNGPLTLAGNSNLYTAALGTITFGSTIQGGFNLIANASSTGTVNFNNDIGTVGTPLTGLTVTGLANINTNVAPTVFVSGTQTYNNNVLLNSIAAITFGSGIGSTTVFNGTVNRTVTSTAITIAGNLQVGPLGSIGLSSVIASLLVNGTTLGPNVTTAGNQTYVGAVTLNTDETMTSTGGNITFNSTIDGDGFAGRNLILSAAVGNVAFNGIVGGGVPLASLSATAGSQINVNTSAISTTGTQSYFGPTFILTPAVMTFTGSDISFNQPILNGGSLITSINIIGNLILDAPSANLSTAGSFGFFDALTVSGSTTINNSNFPAISTKQNQLYSGPVILNSNGGILGFVGFASTSGNITFGSTIEGTSVGAQSLVVNANSGIVNFSGNVGLSVPLSSITVSAATIQNNGISITTTGAQNYTGNMRILNSTNGTFNTTLGGDITFNGVIGNSDNATIFSGNQLVTNSTGQVIFNDDVGIGAFGLAGVDLTAANGIVFNNVTVTTISAQTYHSPVILNGNVFFTTYIPSAVDFLSTVDSCTPGPGCLTPGSFSSLFNSINVFNVAPSIINFSGAIGSNNPLSSFSVYNINGPVTFNSTLDVAGPVSVIADAFYSNSLNTPPTITFNGAIGSLTPPTNFDVVSTSFFPAYDTSIIINSSLVATGAVTLTASSAGAQTVILNGNVNAGTLNVQAPTEIDINASNITTSGDQFYNGSVILGLVPVSTLKSTAGNITFYSTINGTNNLVIDAALTANFNGSIGDVTPLGSLTVTAPSGIVFNAFANTIHTSGDQLFNNIVALNLSSATFTSDTGDITFNSVINTTGTALTVNAVAGSAIFYGDINNGSGPSISITAPDGIFFNASTPQTLIILWNPGNVGYLFDGPVILAQNLTVTTVWPALQDIIFTNTIDSCLGGQCINGVGPFTLTVANGDNNNNNGANLIFNGAIGGNAPLGGLTTWYQGSHTIFNGPVTVYGDVYVNTEYVASGTSNNSITFGSGAVLFATGNIQLPHDGGANGRIGTININDTVTSLGSIDMDAATINLNGGSVISSAGQTYGPGYGTGVVNLLSNTVLTSINSSITFNNTVEGPGGLIANVLVGTMYANQHMGFNTPLGYLTVNGTAQGVNIISVGDIIMGPFNVVTNDLVQSLAGNVNFTGGPVTLFANLDVIAAEQIFFGAGANGVTGPFALSAQSLNPIYGPTGQGVTGTVNVASFTLGGPGGGHLSQNYPITESFVNGQGVGQAIMNTLISPDFRASGAIYCVNNFCTLLPVENPPSDIPPRQIINPPESTACGAAGCDNLEIIVGKNYCAYSEINMNDNYYEYKKDDDKNKMYRKLLWKQEQDCLCQEDYRKINKDKYWYERESKDKWAKYCKQQKDLVYLTVNHHPAVPQKVSLKNVMAMMKLHHPVEQKPDVKNNPKISLEHFPITKGDMYMR